MRFLIPDIDTLRQRAIRIIAATRFPLIDQEDWPDEYITITNEDRTRRARAEGKKTEAEKLLEENQISYAGLRTWAVRHGSLIVTSIRTPDDPKDHRGSE